MLSHRNNNQNNKTRIQFNVIVYSKLSAVWLKETLRVRNNNRIIDSDENSEGCTFLFLHIHLKISPIPNIGYIENSTFLMQT